jgi:hypothetical protein
MARNVISGNDEDGVLIDNGSSGNQVLGNYIGTDASGSVGLGNTRVGVRISDASSNTVGGTTAQAGNVISGNGRNGVAILGSMSSSNLVQGNFIGTDAGGRAALGNARRGVLINNQASDNAIGGTADGAGNVIANNLEEGAHVRISGVGNSILRNSIVSNEFLGIELGDSDGVTPNDSNDPDTGPNDLQNHPLLTWADATPTPDITIEGDLNTTGNTDFRIEFFANRNCDGSGSGEGERFLGFTNETTLGTGNVSFSLVLSVPVTDGESIVATATNPGGSTSEFSACFTATCSNLVTFAHTITAQDKNTLLWSGPDDIRFARGDLADASTYTTTDDGFLLGVSSLDISADSPEPGSGLFYVVKPLGCGSWQTSLGAEPGRESGLP